MATVPEAPGVTNGAPLKMFIAVAGNTVIAAEATQAPVDAAASEFVKTNNEKVTVYVAIGVVEEVTKIERTWTARG